MSRKTWTLTDVEADVFVEQISIGPEDVGGRAKGYRVTKRRLHGGLRDGVDVVEVDNGRFRFTAIPTRGMGIWRASCGDVQLGWQSPAKGPVHPAFVPLWEGTGLGWLSGFDEFLCRCGLESNGAPEFSTNGGLCYPIHGRIANTPAHKVELTVDGDSGEIAVTGVVDEARLYGNKLRMTTTISTKVGQPSITIADEIASISAEPAELELLYHINFGIPLLSPGARVVLPVKKLVPRDAITAADVPHWNVYGQETAGLREVCHYFDLAADPSGRTRALLCSADSNRGVSLSFNKNQLPCFTIWKNRQQAIDGYVTGLEPAINYPNPRTFESAKGRVARLLPGESRRFEVTIEVHAGAAGLAAAERDVATIQQGVTPQICDRPDSDWSAC
jgi:hypothetical protein